MNLEQHNLPKKEPVGSKIFGSGPDRIEILDPGLPDGFYPTDNRRNINCSDRRAQYFQNRYLPGPKYPAGQSSNGTK